MNAKNMKEPAAPWRVVDVPYTARLMTVIDGRRRGRSRERGTETHVSSSCRASGAPVVDSARSREARANDAPRTRQRCPAEKTTAGDVFVLSVPLFVELFMQIMIGNINQFMLAPLGTEPAAAVGNALQILNIVTIALSAMGTASTVLVTRVLGKSSATSKVSEIATVASW